MWPTHTRVRFIRRLVLVVCNSILLIEAGLRRALVLLKECDIHIFHWCEEPNRLALLVGSGID